MKHNIFTELLKEKCQRLSNNNKMFIKAEKGAPFLNKPRVPTALVLVFFHCFTNVRSPSVSLTSFMSTHENEKKNMFLEKVEEMNSDLGFGIFFFFSLRYPEKK